MKKIILLAIACLLFTNTACTETRDAWLLYRTLVEANKKRVKAIALNHNGSKLVAVGRRYDCFLSVWDVDRASKIKYLNLEMHSVGAHENACIGCNKDASVVVLSFNQNGINTYYLSARIPSYRFNRLPVDQSAVSITGDNGSNTFLIGMADGTYCNYDADRQEFVPVPADTQLPRPDISACGNYELSNGSVIDTRNNQKKPCVLKYKDSIASDIACFSGDSSLLATRCPDNTIRVWANSVEWAFCQDE